MPDTTPQSPRHAKLPSVSIVAEWETVLGAGRERGIACLTAINRQLWALRDESAASSEMIVCLDPAEACEDSVVDALAQAHAGRGWPCRVEVAVAPRRLDYYQKKSYGFTRSTGDVVVFIDTDLIPEADWLANLLEPFRDYRRSVVVGRTHLETTTPYERGVALFWIFDTRDSRPTVRLTRRLVSNNVAFRRAVFTHFPFPDRPTYRGQCAELGSILAAHSIALYEQPAARACHPAPAGVRAFLARALHAGGDQYFYDALDGMASLGHGARQWRTDLERVGERVRRRRRDIRAGLPSISVALVLGFVYYSMKAAGYGARCRCLPGSALGQPMQKPA